MRFYKKNRDPGFQKSIPVPIPGPKIDPGPSADPWIEDHNVGLLSLVYTIGSTKSSEICNSNSIEVHKDMTHMRR